MNVEVIKGNNRVYAHRKGGSGKGKLRVAAYCRVSTNDEDQLNSYRSQVTYYTELIKKKDDWLFAGIYADEGITGTQVAKREEFQRLINDCMNGEVDMVITKSISRFARNTLDTLKYVRMLKERNIAVFFEEENINTLTMDGELLLVVLSSVAQQEVENISANVKKGLKMKMQRGEMVGFQGCLGYDYDPVSKTISVNEEEAEIVRYIFRRYIEGAGGSVISKELRNLGYKTKRGGTAWPESTVIGIIKNEKYKGDLLMGKTFTVDPISKRRLANFGEEDRYYLADHHEPIISKEMFQQVQQLKQHRLQKNGSRIGPITPLHKKLYCGICGGGFRRKNCRNITYWSCVSHEQNQSNCPITQIPEREIQAAFLRAYHRLQMDGIPVLRQLEANLRKIREQRFLWRVDIVELNKQIGNLMDQNRMLAEMQKHGLLDSDLFLSQTNGIAQKLRETQAKKERLLGENEDQTLEQTKELLESLSSMPEFLPDFDEGIFVELVEQITVESNTSLCFCLKNGIKLRETIERSVRR